MSRARECFDEGEEAFHDGIERDDCPYPDESSEAANWCAGWDSAEHENNENAKDDAYNDPRRGQAYDLNRGR